MQYYQKYLRTRLEQCKGSSTVIDRAIVLAIDNCGAHGDFTVAVFLDTECYVCMVLTDRQRRYCILKMDCYDHSASAAAATSPGRMCRVCLRPCRQFLQSAEMCMYTAAPPKALCSCRPCRGNSHLIKCPTIPVR